MRPSHLEPFVGSDRRDRRQTWSQDNVNIQAQSRQSTRRSRFEDSWIDITSQPSSSSLAPQAERDEIITTGLQLRRETDRRSRHLRRNNINAEDSPRLRSTSAAGSSQDEYTESESDSDRLLSSSNEDVANNSNTEEDQDEDNRTALGVPTTDRNIFTPQPNAFSHPPNARSVPISNSAPTDSYFPPQSQPLPSSSHRIPSNRVPTIQRPSHQRVSSNIPPDHDAALRASLTTLLSCANAVRKDKDHSQSQPTRWSNQPTVLRLVPESELNTRRSPPHSPKAAPKRRSRESSKERHTKKLKAATKPSSPEEMIVSPTMMTWFISAGIVVVFSAISFSAGYAWGKEIGRFEGQMSIDGVSCGKEAIRGSRTGLSKIRLSSVAA